MEPSYIDLHCHSALKPFGKSFQRIRTTGINHPNPSEAHSIWHVQRPKLFRKVLNVFLRLTKWRQADFSTLVHANVNVIITSLYPLEKGMVVHPNGGDVKYSGRLLRNLATGISMRRVRHLQKMPDYFQDLEAEYEYYLQLHTKTIRINGISRTYKLIRKASDINFSDKDTLHVIMSIEGAHVFNCGLQLANRPKANKDELLQNIDKVKQWTYRPFFIGLAHHFDNELCGFAKSFSGLVASQIKQRPNKDLGLTDLGKVVLLKLLNNEQGNRILIDLKHMNPKSRYAYYNFLDLNFKNERIPLIVSHGALNGKLHPFTHNYVMRSGFNKASINFYFDEIQKIERSGGIFGIQLDERRIFDSKTKDKIYRKAKSQMTPHGREVLRRNSYFIWRQIEHIARYLDTLGLPAWNIQALGTDFDGIIDPLNGWWTAREVQYLDSYLEHHAADFLRTKAGQRLKLQNQLSTKTIVQKVLFSNAKQFISKHFV